MGCKVQVIVVGRHPLEQSFRGRLPHYDPRAAREHLPDTADLGRRVREVSIGWGHGKQRPAAAGSRPSHQSCSGW